MREQEQAKPTWMAVLIWGTPAVIALFLIYFFSFWRVW
jgi:hypothetical protein